jgi:hypothetical protein
MTIYQVTLKQRYYDQEVRNVFYYETTVGDPSTSEWKDIADEIRSDLDTYWNGRCVPEWEFYAIEYREVDTPGLLSFEAIPTSGSLFGTDTGEGSASQLAVLCRVKGTSTKPNRARSYLCGVAADKIVDSKWDSGTTDSAEDFIDEMSVLNNAGTNTLQRVAAQWNTAHTEVTVTNNISAQASLASEVPATQRRRRLGVGI